MLVGEFCRRLDILGCKNLSRKVRFQNVLKAGHFGMIEKAAARAYVRIDESRVGRVLPPMAELVAVGVQDWIEAQRLDGGLLSPVAQPFLAV